MLPSRTPFIPCPASLVLCDAAGGGSQHVPVVVAGRASAAGEQGLVQL